MTNDKTDIENISLAIAGDAEAFRILVDKYRNMVFTIALRMLGSREEAEDVAQEVFVKCFRSLKNFNHRAQFSTWLYKIAYNHSIDQMKKLKTHRRSVELDSLNVHPAGYETESAENLDHQKIQSLLKDAIQWLPPDDQVIVILYYYDDRPLKEIAEIVGLKENNIKIRLHRIRQKLATKLQSKKDIISSIIP